MVIKKSKPVEVRGVSRTLCANCFAKTGRAYVGRVKGEKIVRRLCSQCWYENYGVRVNTMSPNQKWTLPEEVLNE